ncbi:MAG: response regulator [Alphaproteobacteria bacterium]|nr:response regulator [Alphaproteobacteria bacterium]
MRVLIVDDSVEIREIIAAYLTAAGYSEPIKAARAEEALALLGVDWAGAAASGPAIEPVDVVLMDIIMPGMDGIEACARIKRHAPLAETPVLMVSSRDDTTALQQAFLAGASDYIRKPIERVELLARIRSALRLRAELERRRAQEDGLRTELDRLRQSLSRAATDPVSGLLSESVARGLAEAALAAGRDVAVLIADIDDRATTAGVMRGEEMDAAAQALAVIAAREPGLLGDLLAVGSVPGRLAIVLVDRSLVEAAAFAERLRLSVGRARVPQANARSGIVTVSIGIAHRTGWDEEGTDPFETAGRAAAAASARGGNRVEIADPDRSTSGQAAKVVRNLA